MFRTPLGLSSPELASATEDSPVVQRSKRRHPELEMMDMFSALQADLKDSFQNLQLDLDTKLSKINDNIGNLKSDLDNYTMEIKKEISEIRTENKVMKQKVHDLSQQVSTLRESTQFISDQQDNVNNRVDVLTTHVRSVCQFEPSLKELQAKMDSLEQQARACNLEITNMPEKRGENLVNLLEAIGTSVGCAITKKDVTAVHRVPHAQLQDSKPKNIIAKLTSRTLRDNFLSAFRLKKGLKTDQLGMSGTPQTIYLNEHLTLRNKGLFRETREAARKFNFKYVWVKHATILVRKSENSHVLAIRSSKDIERMAAPTPQGPAPGAITSAPRLRAPCASPGVRLQPRGTAATASKPYAPAPGPSTPAPDRSVPCFGSGMPCDGASIGASSSATNI